MYIICVTDSGLATRVIYRDQVLGRFQILIQRVLSFLKEM